MNFKRTLNEVLVDLDPYPMSRIDNLFNKIGEGNKYFASLDLQSDCWQIVIAISITWRDRCYKYTRPAFGLTSAGLIFSHCIAEALATVACRDIISYYIDDNLIHAKTFEECMFALEQLYTALCKFGLKLNPNKYTFLDSRGEVPRRNSKQRRILGRPWIRPRHQRNGTPNIEKGITKSYRPFRVSCMNRASVFE